MSRITVIAASACLLLFAAPHPLPACELCAIYSASQARGQSTQGPSIALAEQFTHSGTIQLDGREVPNPACQFLDSSTTQLVPGYSFTDRFGVEVAVPLIYRHFRRSEPSGIQTGDVSGLGDLSLFGTYEVYRINKMKSSVSVDLFAGVKFPTGSTSRLKEETQESDSEEPPVPSAIHGHDLTLGTGSYDGFFGGSVFARWRKVFGSARIQYAARTTGDYDYRFGNDTLWSSGPGYFVLASDQFTLSAAFNVSGEVKALDAFRGQSVPDTGVNAVYVGPELVLTAGEHINASLALDLPVLLDTTSLQIVPNYRLRAGFSWRF